MPPRVANCPQLEVVLESQRLKVDLAIQRQGCHMIPPLAFALRASCLVPRLAAQMEREDQVEQAAQVERCLVESQDWA